jgi:hypothetical protein
MRLIGDEYPKQVVGSFRTLAGGWTPQTVDQFLIVTSSRSFAVRISPFAFRTSTLKGFPVRLSRT